MNEQMKYHSLLGPAVWAWETFLSLFWVFFMTFLIPDLLGCTACGCLRPGPGWWGAGWGLEQPVLLGGGRGLKQDYNPCSAGFLFCVNGEMRFPALQILLVLFVELKPIYLLLTFELGLPPGFSVFSVVKEVIGLFGGLTPFCFPDGSPTQLHPEIKRLRSPLGDVDYVALKGFSDLWAVFLSIH